MRFRAVIFDLGGVVFPSPIDGFREYERRVGLPHRFISDVIIGSDEDGAWARLERGEVALEEFAIAFEAECAVAGEAVRAADMFAALQGGEGGGHPAMLTAIARIREEGLKTAALTNNWVADDGAGMQDRVPGLSDVFDVMIESSVVGLRKPDPRIYELACSELAVSPTEAVFLDDLGVNLKPARAMGMTTIKVAGVDAALAELEAALGFSLSETA
ncbi:MAG: HAD-IA family hydrolase [Acidimicrobiia bacterium]